MTKEPFIAHSELTNEIYIVTNKEKYRVTEQAIKAVMAIKALEQEPCEDCISRQDALDCLTATGLKKFDFILDARDKIKNLPSVKPQEPKTGHWKRIGYDIYECSICGQDVMTSDICAYRYCHGCGARMESEES